MSLFAIYAKADATNKTPFLQNEEVVVIKDRFSIFACLLTPIWCIWHRLWLELIAYIGVAFIMGFVAFFVGEGAAGWIGFLVAILIGLEAAAIRGFSLSRKGFEHKGDIIATNPQEAEWRYIAGQLNQNAQKPQPLPPASLPNDEDHFIPGDNREIGTI